MIRLPDGREVDPAGCEHCGLSTCPMLSLPPERDGDGELLPEPQLTAAREKRYAAEWVCLDREAVDWRAVAGMLPARVGVLEAALRKVAGDGSNPCGWCGKTPGHRPDCSVGNALAGTVPAPAPEAMRLIAAAGAVVQELAHHRNNGTFPRALAEKIDALEIASDPAAVRSIIEQAGRP